MIKVNFNINDKNEIVNYANRGMSLECEINETIKYLLENDICLIYKKATPIKVVKVESNVIKEAYFNEESTLDYAGVYKGKYLDFEAKETDQTTSFPLKNVMPHQLKHMENVIKNGGYSFLLITFSKLNEYYILDAKILLDFIKENERKSLPLTFIKEKGIKIDRLLNPPLDLISGLNKLIF